MWKIILFIVVFFGQPALASDNLSILLECNPLLTGGDFSGPIDPSSHQTLAANYIGSEPFPTPAEWAVCASAAEAKAKRLRLNGNKFAVVSSVNYYATVNDESIKCLTEDNSVTVHLLPARDMLGAKIKIWKKDAAGKCYVTSDGGQVAGFDTYSGLDAKNEKLYLESDGDNFEDWGP